MSFIGADRCRSFAKQPILLSEDCQLIFQDLYLLLEARLLSLAIGGPLLETTDGFLVLLALLLRYTLLEHSDVGTPFGQGGGKWRNRHGFAEQFECGSDFRRKP